MNMHPNWLTTQSPVQASLTPTLCDQPKHPLRLGLFLREKGKYGTITRMMLSSLV